MSDCFIILVHLAFPHECFVNSSSCFQWMIALHGHFVCVDLQLCVDMKYVYILSC